MEGDELPAGWVACTIGKSAEYVQRGKSPKYADQSPLSVINQKCVRWSGIEKEHARFIHEDQISKWDQVRYLQRGDLLWNSTGTGTIGRACLYAGEFKQAVVDSHITIVRADKRCLDPSYLRFFVMSPFVQMKFDEMQSGSTNQVELSKAAVTETSMPLAPLPEQQRIVEKIETLFAELDKGEEALREVQKLLARYRQSVLKAAVTGTLTADWRAANGLPQESGNDLLARILKTRRETWQGRGKYEEPVEPDTDGLPDLPEGWVWVSFAQLFEVGKDGGKKLPQKQYALEGEYPVIDQGEAFVGGYSDDESLVYEDSLPVILFGDHTRRFKLVTEQFICGADGVKIVCPSRLLPAEFSYLVLKSADFEDRGYSRHFQFVRKLVLPLPPLGEVEEIIDVVSAADAQAAEAELLIETELKRSAALRQSILKDAFSGKLVPQVPSDEPAEKLLDRIRAARDEKPNAKRKKAAA